MLNIQPDDPLGKEELADALAQTLSNVVVFQYMVHGFHWNVRGPLFSQYHEFFGEIYEDAQGSEDDLAENIRRLGYDAPFMLPQFMSLSGIQYVECSNDPLEMSQVILQANSVVLDSLSGTFDIANTINEQGTANFIAERLDMHKKWQWQLNATLGLDENMGKTKAESPLEVSDHDYSLSDTDIQPEEIFVPVVAAAGDCPPATQDIGINLANREKAIQTAAYGPLNPQEPNEEFWAEKANRWSVDVTEAKKSVCGTCVMFIRTPKMLNCIEGGLAAGDSGEQNAWDAIDQAELGYCEAFDFKCAASRTCNAWVVGGPITEEKGEAVQAAGSKPAPKKDRIKGSSKNAPGSAKNKKKVITFSKEVEASLRKKVTDHNARAKTEGRQATLPMLKAVYRRGAGAYSSSHRPNISRGAWAMARVNAFLHLLKTGRPGSVKYTQDNDLLPAKHPKASHAIVASIFNELSVEIKNEKDYASPEHAIFALAEFSGAGYEIIPALRASWARAVKNNETPFKRAMDLAVNLYNSNDADLLPADKKGTLE